MPKETKFYDLLGVSHTCTEAELKTAYKKGALKFHPDKHGDKAPHEREQLEVQFKEISRAYEVLKEPQTRDIYDRMGEAGLEGSGGMPGGGMAAEDLFAQFFGGGGGGPFGGMFGGGMRDTGPKKARAIHHVHKVSLEDVYKGKVSKLALQKTLICPACDGRGGKEGAVKTCTGCQGQGVKMILRQMGPMIQRFQTVCQDCQGQGEIIREKDKCKRCLAKKTIVERKVLHVHVDRGVQDGHKIDFKGEGDQSPGLQPGDIQFEILTKPHPRFQRRGDDLFYKADIDLLTALAGGNLFIEHLDERWLTVNIFPGDPIKPNMIKVVKGQGMPSYRHHDFGNLYIQFDVKFPEKGDLQSIELLEQVLPPRIPGAQPTKDAMVEDYDLDDVDPRYQARAQGVDDEDDEDGMPAGAERVQCASQ